MNIRQKLIAIILSTLITLFCSTGAAQNIRMATTEWEPFFSSTLPSQGVVTELVRTAFQREGYTTTLDWYPWMRALKMVSDAEVEVLMGAYYSDERNKLFYYSDPLFSVDIGFIALKKSAIKQYQSLESLTPYSIGIMRGWVYTDEFEAADFLDK